MSTDKAKEIYPEKVYNNGTPVLDIVTKTSGANYSGTYVFLNGKIGSVQKQYSEGGKDAVSIISKDGTNLNAFTGGKLTKV